MKSNCEKEQGSWVTLGALLVLALLVVSCARRQAMYDQAKYTPFKESDFFADGRTARMPVPGTVARGHLNQDAHLHTGVVDGKLATNFPFPITRQVLERGLNRYKIYCTPCHSQVGDGNGMIVQRGFYPPPSFHIERLRVAPPGHFFNVMTQGLGNMNGYAAQLKAQDRWAIAAYIRALQLSQNVSAAELSEQERGQLEAPR